MNGCRVGKALTAFGKVGTGFLAVSGIQSGKSVNDSQCGIYKHL